MIGYLLKSIKRELWTHLKHEELQRLIDHLELKIPEYIEYAIREFEISDTEFTDPSVNVETEKKEIESIMIDEVRRWLDFGSL